MMSTEQESERQLSMPLKIGMIGFGSFGQFLAKTLLKQGQIVRATSRSDYSLESKHLGVTFFRYISQLVEADNDVIMICTSIMSLGEVVKSIPFEKLKRPTLFADVLSVKEYPRDVLIKELPMDADLICTHPMFGPESGKNGWDGLPFMYERVRIRNGAICSCFLHIFEQEGCRMLEMSCEEHDRQAARSQFLSHTIGRVLAEMEVEPTPINTKGFQTLLQLKDSTIRDSFELFSGLFVHNRFAKHELKNVEAALGRVKDKLQERDNYVNSS